MVLSADGAALSLPVELIRLAQDWRWEVGPLGLLAAGQRVPTPRGAGPGSGGAARTRLRLAAAGTPGPLKVLAAVAAPDETTTRNAPLDTEAEMQAVLDAVTGVAADAGAQVRILEVASLPHIRQALATGRLPRAAPVRARLPERRSSWRTRTAPRSR